jgi:hypothetical protein
MSEPPMNETGNDWVRRPGMGFVWWCLPFGVGVAANFFASSARSIAFVWVVMFAWMGTGCILNALRCHRLHCYISGPYFFLVPLRSRCSQWGSRRCVSNPLTTLSELRSSPPYYRSCQR